MKKILMISHIELFGFGGGCLENRKYYDGLKYYSEQFNAEIKVISTDKPFEDSFDIVVEKTKKMDLMSRIIGHSTYIFFVWNKYRKKILQYNPDMVVLGRSRMGFIAKDLKKYLPMCKVVVNMENVEYDYVDAYFVNKKGFFKGLYSKIEKFCVHHDEKNAIKYSDVLNYLTKRDYERTNYLYSPNDKIENLIPICINQKNDYICLENRIKTIYFIGSLDYGSNLDALLWFINSVWKQYYFKRIDIQFVIGGSNATEELIDLVKEIPNIKLYNNFEKLNDVVAYQGMLIAPIRSGAGMKVKVAEALSMGLMIAASDEALIGYEKALSENNNGIIRANTAEEFLEAVELYLNIDTNSLNRIFIENSNLYHKYYSYETSRKEIMRLCKKILD